MLNVVLLVVVVGGTILAYPCVFKKGVFIEVCSERCVQRSALNLNAPQICYFSGIPLNKKL